MNTSHSKLVIGALVLATVFSCKKGQDMREEASIDSNTVSYYETEPISDSISSVATLEVKDKKFIKTASVKMDVKDVYDATIAIEKSAKDLGGFVIHSNLQSQIVYEETYNISDENAMLVRKFQTENSMKVRVPTQKLGEFLQQINEKSIFLNSRTIDAEDVTANIKFSEMEAKRNRQTKQNISDLKTDKEKVNMADENMSEENFQMYETMNMTDNLKYSSIEIYIKEPKLRIAEIAVINSKNIDNKYKYNFFYDAKNAFVEGFYLIQTILVLLFKIWPIILIGAGVFYFLRKRKSLSRKD
ncbi:MAG: DUF4349 domain-containing protein [Flavobacteriaceae bacterium]|jgi:hypothetical protein|nr:DUF4349 domain-containing protein [Flavobacteriaceae bacterium]